MTYDAGKSIEIAKSFLGYHEGANNNNQFSAWQGLNPNNPWCASFACYCACNAGFAFPANSTFGVKGEAYTPTMKLRAQQAGYWRDKTWRAQPGDFVEYDWGNDGLIDHVEIVIADDGVHLVTIGGNVSDAVSYRTRDRTYVAGFVALSQAGQSAPVEPPFKVKPVFDPALDNIRDALPHPQGKGTWIALDSAIIVWRPTSGPPIFGGMTSPADRAAWGNRHVARLGPYTRQNGDAGYRIFATDGGTVGYVPEQEH